MVHWLYQELHYAAGEELMEVTYLGRHKGQVVQCLCPPSVGYGSESWTVTNSC